MLQKPTPQADQRRRVRPKVSPSNSSVRAPLFSRHALADEASRSAPPVPRKEPPMNQLCANCHGEYDARLTFCPGCGEPSKASLRKLARKEAGTAPASHATTRTGDFFPNNPRQVEPSPNVEAGARASEASARRKAAEEREPAPRDDEAKPAPALAAPVAGDASLYRTVRMMCMTVIVVCLSTMVGVIVIALIFTSAQQRQTNAMQEQSVTYTAKVLAAFEGVLGELKQLTGEAAGAKAKAEKTEAENVELKKTVAKLKQDNAALVLARAEGGDEPRGTDGRFSKRRLLAKHPNLSKKVINDAARRLDSILAAAKDKKVRSAAEAFRQSLLNRRSWEEIVDAYDRLAQVLDERTKTKVEEEILTHLAD